MQKNIEVLSNVEEDSSYINMPSTPTSKAISSAVKSARSNGKVTDSDEEAFRNIIGNMKESANRRKELDHRSTILLKQVDPENKYAVGYEEKTDKSQSLVLIPDIIELARHNTEASKILELINEKILKIVSGNNIKQNYIEISPTEMVEKGLYKTVESAVQACRNTMGILTSLKFRSSFRIGQLDNTGSVKKKISNKSLTVLITSVHQRNNTFLYYLNDGLDKDNKPLVNWEAFTHYYTTIPEYFYRLKNKAHDLLLLIAIQARQNTNTIKERGYITISNRTIQTYLNLPSEEDNKNPGRIRKYIEDAVRDISEEDKENNIKLELVGDNHNIKAFLDHGYLKVYFTGSYAERFTKLSHKRDNIIDHNTKRKENIEDNIKVAKATGNRKNNQGNKQ